MAWRFCPPWPPLSAPSGLRRPTLEAFDAAVLAVLADWMDAC